jgi:hypothetical protein
MVSSMWFFRSAERVVAHLDEPLGFSIDIKKLATIVGLAEIFILIIFFN